MKVLRDLVGHSLSERYRLVARLAGGGMGEVYRGHDLLLDRPVAVKVMHPSLAHDPLLVERFKAEARAAARLSHPNVVGVHDWGAEAGDTYYMVMEYVPGCDLRDVLTARGALEPAVALETVAAVCDALAAAHAGGLVHRDIKPENILIARDGTVKVADFGIAAVVDADRTTAGTILGTLRYLSPEQAAGGEATTASDVWAAGALLGELATGQPPANGGGIDQLTRRAAEPPARPSELDPGLPREIDDIVTRACALDPAARFESATELGDAMRGAGRLLPPSRTGLDGLVADLTGEAGPGIATPTQLTGSRSANRGAKRRRRIKASLVLLACAAVLLGGAQVLRALGGPDEIDVPMFVGLTKQSAQLRAEEVGVVAKVVDRMSSRRVPRGEVVAQSPNDGTVREGARIELTVSSGPPKVPVRDVTGYKFTIAEVRLRAGGMRVGKVGRQFSLEPPGTVVGQSPGKGRLRWGSEVDVVVSKGPRSLEISDVTGMTAAEARRTLASAGFTATVVKSYSDDVERGRVVSTEPGPLTVAPEGTEVTVYVSIGPEFKELEMPDLRNMDLASAKEKLGSLKLAVNVEQSCGGSGTMVIETDPVAGQTVRENDTVALFVC